MTTNVRRIPGHYMPVIEKDGKELELSVHRAHQAIQIHARRDFPTYYKFMSGFDLAPHHYEWLEAIEESQNNGKSVIITGFRESAKTSVIIQSYLPWFIGKNPYTNSLIAGVTEDLAVSRLEVIRNTIKDPRYQLIFPQLLPDSRQRNNSTALNVWEDRWNGDYGNWRQYLSQEGKREIYSEKDHTLRAVGIGSRTIIGNRYSGLVILDDVVSEENLGPTQQEKLLNWFKRTLLPCMKTMSRLIIIGTRWVPDDFIGNLLREEEERARRNMEPGYIQINTPVMKPVHPPLHGTQVSGIPGEWVPTWPEYWPMDRILDKKDEVGTTIFQVMYMNNPNVYGGQTFKEEDLEEQIPPPTTVKKDRVLICVDPAFETKTRNDNTAIVLLVWDGDKLYNYKIIRGKFTKNKLKENLDYMYAWGTETFGGVDKVLVEQVGTQSLLVSDLIDETDLPIEGVNITNKGDKVRRAQNLSVLAENRKYLADWKCAEGYNHRMELLSLGSAGSADDTVDATTLGANWILFNTRGQRAKVHKIKIRRI